MAQQHEQHEGVRLTHISWSSIEAFTTSALLEEFEYIVVQAKK
jgi:hypothetical protein